MRQPKILRAAAIPELVAPETPWLNVLAPTMYSPSMAHLHRESARANLRARLVDAVQIAARGVDIMLIGQGRCQVPEDNVLADAGHAFLQELEQLPGQFFLQRLVIRRVIARVPPAHFSNAS